MRSLPLNPVSLHLSKLVLTSSLHLHYPLPLPSIKQHEDIKSLFRAQRSNWLRISTSPLGTDTIDLLTSQLSRRLSRQPPYQTRHVASAN